MTNTARINYSANGTRFSFEIENIEDHSPRSIYIACLKNYKATGARNVSMPRYDDDNDEYIQSNTEITIEVTKELFDLPVLFGMSKDEILKMFNPVPVSNGSITARLIGEASAGMTAVEIYDADENLLWSHRWFEDGATGTGYRDGLRDALDCLRECADWRQFDGGSADDDGEPIVYDDSSTTGVMLEYNTVTGWTLGDDARHLGQSREIVDAVMAAGLLPPDEDHIEPEDEFTRTVSDLVSYLRDGGK